MISKPFIFSNLHLKYYKAKKFEGSVKLSIFASSKHKRRVVRVVEGARLESV
jgi:hypothetical protein